MEKLNRYWGPDSEWRSPQGHYEYLVECSKLWRSYGDADQAFRVRLMALEVLRNHRGEFSGSYSAA